MRGRALVLTGKFGDSTNSLTVMSVDPIFNFLGGTIEFPSTIHKGSSIFKTNGQVRGMVAIDFELNSYIFKETSADCWILQHGRAWNPYLVFSSYTVKDRRYYDASLYQLKYQGILSEDKPSNGNKVYRIRVRYPF